MCDLVSYIAVSHTTPHFGRLGTRNKPQSMHHSPCHPQAMAMCQILDLWSPVAQSRALQIRNFTSATYQEFKARDQRRELRKMQKSKSVIQELEVARLGLWCQIEVSRAQKHNPCPKGIADTDEY
ncbi:uncharacterized protein K489DRAFT_143218 [Dissoconium aciculare CBS 342.82]|jgi:hypothetical protein|uniref:Uncharacterized protein n=1 Tax=Dissoconium aciculare CBS 342.82 TaxID=1314786 RepID=A0A6J3M9Y8_9PEZI|nr:uncharacterized protein K489DRAFT_143218 [Dissoconium aciculare CBS 342.82]KAF1824851.1 hypothetical protein K489DRAFT_143218 [Dissoconium aciculare CBS 342.82]